MSQPLIMTATVITIIIIVIGREIKINFNDLTRLNGASLRRGVGTEAQVELMTLTRVGLALLMTHGDVGDVISHTYASKASGMVNDPHERWGLGRKITWICSRKIKRCEGAAELQGRRCGDVPLD